MTATHFLVCSEPENVVLGQLACGKLARRTIGIDFLKLLWCFLFNYFIYILPYIAKRIFDCSITNFTFK